MAYRRGKFLFFLYKNDLKTMSEVLYRATKYMNAEDALSAREDKPRKRERLEDARQDHGGKKPRTGNRREEKRFKPPRRKIYKLHPSERPTRPSTDADQGRRVPDVSREAEERSNQAIQKQVLPFPP